MKQTHRRFAVYIGNAEILAAQQLMWLRFMRNTVPYAIDSSMHLDG